MFSPKNVLHEKQTNEESIDSYARDKRKAVNSLNAVGVVAKP